MRKRRNDRGSERGKPEPAPDAPAAPQPAAVVPAAPDPLPVAPRPVPEPAPDGHDPAHEGDADRPGADSADGAKGGGGNEVGADGGDDEPPRARLVYDPRTARGKALGVLAGGGSFKDAAHFAAVDPRTLYRWRTTDAAFAAEVRRAIAAGKMSLIGKVRNASQWQASAWVLERKWPEEWGRGRKGARRAKAATIRIRHVPASPAPPSLQGPPPESRPSDAPPDPANL